MGVEYSLIIAGEVPVEEVAECAVPDLAQHATPAVSARQVSADLYESLGFWLSVRSARDGYFEADDDGGSVWQREFNHYLNVTFAMGKDEQVERRISNMLVIVARVLDCRSEDAALIQNYDALLLTRLQGELRKHNRADWWDHYGFVNELIPG